MTTRTHIRPHIRDHIISHPNHYGPPDPPPVGYEYVIDEFGIYVLDETGAFIVQEL